MEMKQVVAYIRASSQQQLLTPDVQRASITEFCTREGYVVAEWFTDLGVSGDDPIDKRSAFADALNALQRDGVVALVVAKRDRLARDVFVAAMAERIAEKAGAKILSADGVPNDATPEARLMRTIIDAFAAYELALIKSRTKAALDEKRKKGHRIGQIPYGKKLADDGVTLIPAPREIDAVGSMRRFRCAGWSNRKIARWLNAEGAPAKNGGKWYHTSVAAVLRCADSAEAS